MRCILLAAGMGTRLRPITDTLPKCLAPIRGKPLLRWWLEHLHTHGCTEVLINTHYKAELVQVFLQSWAGTPTVHTAYEPQLLGSAGTLRRHRAFAEGVPHVLVANADNLTNADLTSLCRGHQRLGRPLTVGLYRAPDPTQAGLAHLDADSRIVAFEEKPARPSAPWANAGIYVMTLQVLDAIPDRVPIDIGRDLLPAWIGRMSGVPIEGYLRDIGTPEAYAAAQEEWAG